MKTITRPIQGALLSATSGPTPTPDNVDQLVYTKKVPMNNNRDPEVYGGLKRNDGTYWIDDPDLAPYHSSDYYLEFSLDNHLYLPIIYMTAQGEYVVGESAFLPGMKIAELEYLDNTHYSICAECGATRMFNGTFETNWNSSTITYLGTYTYLENGEWKTATVQPDAGAAGTTFINVDVIVKVWKKAK